MDAYKMLKKVQMGFLMNQPGYGLLSYNLRLIADDTIKTACTDGKVLKFNPSFIELLSEGKRQFVYAHELLHCAFFHCTRRQNRIPMIWNMAVDYATNIHLKDAIDNPQKDKNFTMELWEHCLVDKKYRGWLVENIYKDIFKNAEKINISNPNWNIGDVEDAPTDENGNGQSKEDLEQEWKIATVQAAQAQIAHDKSKGNKSGFWEGMIEAITQRKLGFEGWLHRFMAMTSKLDYSWSKFNKRVAALGVHLPGMKSAELGNIAIALDASGSISDTDIGKFLGKVSLLRQQYPCTVTIMVFDTKVNSIQEFSLYDELQIKIKGRGCTSFVDIFSRINEENINAVALLIFTDGYGDFPDKHPDIPTLWVSTEKDINPPFGDWCLFEE